MLVAPNTFTVFIKPASIYRRSTQPDLVYRLPYANRFIRISDIYLDDKETLVLKLVLPDYIVNNGVLFIGEYNTDQNFFAVKVNNIRFTRSDKPIYVHLYTEYTTDLKGTIDSDHALQLLIKLHLILTDTHTEPLTKQLPTLQYFGCVKLVYNSENKKWSIQPVKFVDEYYAPEYKNRPYALYIVVPANPQYILTYGLTDYELHILPLTEGTGPFSNEDLQMLDKMLRSKWNPYQLIDNRPVDINQILEPVLILDTPNSGTTEQIAGAITIIEHIFIGANIPEDKIAEILSNKNFGVSASRIIKPESFAV